MSSKIPEFRTDEELEAFLAVCADCFVAGELQARAVREFLPKTRQVNLRFSEALLDAVRERARQEGESPTSATSAKRSSARSTTAAETGDATTSSSERSSKLRSVRKRITSCDGVNMNRERRDPRGPV